MQVTRFAALTEADTAFANALDASCLEAGCGVVARCARGRERANIKLVVYQQTRFMVEQLA